jgi:hypothetical protein
MGDRLMEWIDWMTANPGMAVGMAVGGAVALLIVVVAMRLSFAWLGRRILVGLRLRKKVERESPWATLDDRVAFGVRPAPRPWWAVWRKA